MPWQLLQTPPQRQTGQPSERQVVVHVTMFVYEAALKILRITQQTLAISLIIWSKYIVLVIKQHTNL